MLGIKRGDKMKLSTKGKYGLRAMIDLARYSEKEPVSIGSVAARQGISERYLEQLVALLKKAGLPLLIAFMYGAFTLSGLPSQAVPLTNQLTYAVLNPSMHARWFGLFRVRSPLLPESMFLSLPPAT